MVRGAVRRLSNISNCAFECDYDDDDAAAAAAAAAADDDDDDDVYFCTDSALSV